MKLISLKIFFKSIFAVGLLSLSNNVASQPINSPPLPSTPEENYAVGQQFAHCSGHFAFAALIAKRNDKTDAATAFEDMARGWKLAGMFFLAEAMSKGREGETERVFDNLVQNKISVLKAKHELDSSESTAEAVQEYKDKCEPWLQTQKKIIEILRRG